MNALEIELLKLSFNSFKETGNRYFEFPIKNPTELLHYTESARYLDEDGYIVAVSDNILSDSIPILASQLASIAFEITDKGIEYIRDYI